MAAHQRRIPPLQDKFRQRRHIASRRLLRYMRRITNATDEYVGGRPEYVRRDFHNANVVFFRAILYLQQHDGGH